MAIQSKKKAVIQKGNGLVYNPATFDNYKVPNFHTIEDPEELLQLIHPFEFVNGRKFITFDTETHPHFTNSHEVPASVVRRWVGSGKTAVPQDYPFCMSICDGINAYSIYDSVQNGFAKFKKLAPLFEDPTIEKIAHNTKFDMHMFANAGLKIVGKLHDTVVLCKLANENRHSFELKKLSEKDGIVTFEYMVENYKQTAKVTDYRQIPKELLSEYANADVWNAYIRFVTEYPMLIRDDLVDLYDTEMELMVALYAMERRGMKSDKEYEAELKEDLQALSDNAEAAIYKAAGKTFNINSTQQLYEVLVSVGVPESAIPRTDKGNASLKAEVLESLANKCDAELLQHILTFRKYEKLLGTYANGIYSQRDSDFFVHCSVNQTEATTGRMSITKPALQTLPKKDKRIRRCFLPANPEDLLVFMDLDQVEYRLYAHYSKSVELCHMIDEGYDIHKATAAIIYNVPIDDVTDAQRANGKTINFALIYGVGVAHLAELLRCSVSEAEQMKALYFIKLPEARPFIMSVHQVIKVRGFVKNFFGRRRRLSTEECYKAPNALIQGCAADYIKSKMVKIYKYICYNNLKTSMVNIVHDELIFNIPPDELNYAPIFRWLLSDFDAFRCKITAGIEIGNPSWGQKIEADSSFNHFAAPSDDGYLQYNIFDGRVFDI